MKCLKFGLQFTHVSRHLRAWNRKQKNCFGKTVLKCGLRNSQKKTCCVPIIRQRLGTLLCLLVFFFILFFLFLHFFLQVVFFDTPAFYSQILDHIFKTVFPQDLFCFVIYTLKCLETCVNAVTKCVKA